jgi:hypothetical protein
MINSLIPELKYFFYGGNRSSGPSKMIIKMIKTRYGLTSTDALLAI